ncbi:MAG: hypothetical protein ACLP52_31835 [Streptosporangiaceae bacterium]
MTTETASCKGGGEQKVRWVGVIRPFDCASIYVSHIYESGVCDHGNQDWGLVSITVDHGEDRAGVTLTAAEALLLADRLVRAAHLVLELGEDAPDPDREYQRHLLHDDAAEFGPF